mmetsp:Transcript_86711/g.153174  ORF Transcript_86711/g.153174 Transcript_86711/m.153174 type:complete len:309 (-) Transcript_86711:82-1008(-)
MFRSQAMARFFMCLACIAQLATGEDHEANMWFWGCYYGGNCSVVPDHIWSLISTKRIATGVFPGFGHAMHSNAAFGIAGAKATAKVAELVVKAHAINVTVRPLIEYWDKTSNSYKLFVRNETQQDKFIQAFLQDAIANNYDGYNFDWEFGNFSDEDEQLMAGFLTKFAKALAPHGKQVSTSQGDMRFSNTHYVGEPNYVGYSMGTYSSHFTSFLHQLSYGVSKWFSNGKSDLAHFGVGLSAATTSWKVPPTEGELKERFCALYATGVKRIALFGSNWLDQYAPFLQDFAAGKQSFGGPCLKSAMTEYV